MAQLQADKRRYEREVRAMLADDWRYLHRAKKERKRKKKHNLGQMSDQSKETMIGDYNATLRSEGHIRI